MLSGAKHLMEGLASPITFTVVKYSVKNVALIPPAEWEETANS